MISLKCGIQKIQQTSEYNKKKQTYRPREQTTGHQWGERRGQGQCRGRGVRGINY